MDEAEALTRFVEALAREDGPGPLGGEGLDAEALTRAIDALAREDVRGLLDEARELARERVRRRLAGELERRLVTLLAEAASGPHEPADRAERPRGGTAPAAPAAETRADPDAAHTDAPRPNAATGTTSGGAEGGRGVYVYAVVDADAAAELAGDRSGVAGAPVRIVGDGRLRALVSDVPFDQFGDEGLRNNLNDLTWLSQTAFAHEAVLDDALGVATLVPMRLCTIFRSDAAVQDMLARERASFEEALARLRGSGEWGVKVIADPRAVADAVADRSERVRSLRETIESAGEGAGYLAARQLERLTQEEVAAELDACTRAIHASLSALARDERVNPPSNRDLAGYTGDMVLNAAYLVPDPRREEFRALVESLAVEHRGNGLAVELTGPWPPYNFSTMAGAL